MDDNKTKHDRDDDEPVRQGDILGLGGAVVPKSQEDKRTSTNTGESTSLDDDEQSRETAYRRTPGATGIDMGAGGSGTDVE
jgi:hypothetical protein